MISFLEIVKKDTVGETYKEINRLLQEGKIDTTDLATYEADYTAFQKKVQAVCIDALKFKEGVITCLLSNDPYLVKRILQCDWFFEDALKAQDYQFHILPRVSFSTRCKIINKLSRHCKSKDEAEELFEILNTKYGKKYAEMMLPKCSIKFINDYIVKARPTFNYHGSETVLINICKRCPSLMIPYLQHEMLSGLRGSMERCCKLIKYMSKHHPGAFLPVFEKFYAKMDGFRFGKKSSKALRSDLMKLAKKVPAVTVSGKIEVSEIFKRLNFEDQKTFVKLLVKANGGADSHEVRCWGFASSEILQMLELKPPRERVELVESAFEELFHKKYMDHPEVWSLRFLEAFPQAYRVNLVKILQKRCNEKEISDSLLSQCLDSEREPKDTFIYLSDFRHGFSLLNKLVEQMPTIEKREIILKEMIRNSTLDRDPRALEAVVSYISHRHQNEDPRMLYRIILSYLLRDTPLSLIQGKTWYTMEKLSSLLVAHVKESFLHWEVLEGYIAYSMQKNLKIDSLVKTMVKLNLATFEEGSVLMRHVRQPYSRALLIHYYNEIFSGDEEYAAKEVKERLCLNLLLTLNEYNRFKRRRRINIEGELPLLVEVIDNMILTDEWKKKTLFVKGILRNAYLKNKHADQLIDVAMDSQTLYFLLKRYPANISKNVVKIMNHILLLERIDDYEKFFTARCHIDFLDLSPRIEEIISDKFKTAPSTLIKINALRYYSLVANIENYKELVKDYIPKDGRLVYENENPMAQQIQLMVPGLIRNVKPSSKNWSMLVTYFNKDYIRWVLPSLLCFTRHNSPEFVIPILKHQYCNKPVTVKKIIMRCILDLSTNVNKFRYCKSQWEEEINPSVREFLFKCLLKILRENPSAEIFQMVSTCIREGNEGVFKGRMRMELVPLQFLSEYSTLLWQYTEKCLNRRFVKTCREEMVRNINMNNIPLLPGDLCQKILKLFLFISDADLKVEHVARAYLLRHPQDLSQKLSYIVGLLKERRVHYCAVKRFIEQMKDIPSQSPETSFAVFEAIANEWPKIYSPSKMFKEYLFVNYVKAYSIAYRTARDEAFGSALGQELRKVVNAVPKYNCYVDLFNQTLSEFINSFNFGRVLASLVDSFLGNVFGQTEALIVISLLPDEAFENYKMRPCEMRYNFSHNAEVRKKYRSIVRKMMDKNDDVLNVYLNIRMRNVLD